MDLPLRNAESATVSDRFLTVAARLVTRGEAVLGECQPATGELTRTTTRLWAAASEPWPAALGGEMVRTRALCGKGEPLGDSERPPT